MEEPEKWEWELNKPLPGGAVTVDDLEEDANSFLAFAAAMGVKPPAPDATK